MKHFTLKITFPTFLTIFRLVVGFFIIPVCIVTLCPYNAWHTNLLCAGLFLLVASTDFLDGYLARLYKQESYVGTVLDPLADKFLMFSTWIALLAVGKVWYIWILLLMGREFLITSLRSLAVEKNFVIPVSWMAKIKTTVHVFCFAWIIANSYQYLEFDSWYNHIEYILIAASLFFSLYSGWQYCVLFFQKYNEKE